MIGLIVAVVFLVLLWAGTLVFLPSLWWVAAIVTFVVLAALATSFAVSRARARKAAKQIERALAAQADAQEKDARPDLQPEIQAMRAEFSKALAALESSKLARRGRGNALSVLPWYLIIGPPGAGKSTALRNSGLKFPYLSKRGGVRGVGGTRNCEWWMTNEAVILDTAGRYTTEDDDQDEWLAFLDSVAKARPRQPINGLILAVSASELLSTDAQGAAELGQRLRERVDEVTARLGMVVPVYVLLTKCDLLAGFSEMFADLARADRGRIWGFTVPLGAGAEEPRELLLSRFDELASVLEDRVVRRLGEERRLEARERIYHFPRQFESLRGLLAELVQPLFSENPYQDTPLFRGLYFTSGTQEGRPIDQVMEKMASAFGIRPSAPQAAPATEARSYFLRDLFSEILFRDQRLAVRSSAEAHRRRVLRHAWAAGALVFALATLSLPTVSFFRNRELVRQAERAVQTLGPDWERASDADVLRRLVPLRDLVKELEAHREHGVPVLSGFGMYQGRTIRSAARALFATPVRKLLADPLLDSDAEVLLAFVDGVEREGKTPSAEEFVDAFTRLEQHLYLTRERQRDELAPGEEERASMVERLVARAQLGSLKNADAELVASLAKLHVQLMSDLPELASPRRARLVERSRGGLRRLNMLAQVRVQRLVDVMGHEGDITLQSAMGPASVYFKSNRGVAFACTKEAWPRVRRWLDEAPLSSEAWVLDEAPSQREEEERARLREAFHARCQAEWRAFADSIRFEPKKGEDPVAIVRVLSSGEVKPLKRLLKTFADNLQVEPADPGEKSLAKDLEIKLKKTVLHDPDARHREALHNEFEALVRFGIPKSEGAATHLDEYQQRLAQLKEALAEKQGGNGSRARELVKDVDVWLKEQSRWQRLLTQLTVAPLRSVAGYEDGIIASGLNGAWCSDVVIPFRRSLLPYHPFRSRAPDAPLADFIQMYGPGGSVAGFFESYLREDLRLVGGTPRPVPGKRGGTTYHKGFLAFLGRWDEIRTSFFDGGELKTRFHVQMLTVEQVDSVTFSVDGDEIEYRNGMASLGQKDMQWPGPTKARDKLGASLVLRRRGQIVDQISEVGEWGLFRLMAQAKSIELKSPRQFKLIWRSEKLKEDIQILFTTERTASPFFGARGAKPGIPLFPFFGGGVVRPPPNAAVGPGGCNP